MAGLGMRHRLTAPQTPLHFAMLFLLLASLVTATTTATTTTTTADATTAESVQDGVPFVSTCETQGFYHDQNRINTDVAIPLGELQEVSIFDECDTLCCETEHCNSLSFTNSGRTAECRLFSCPSHEACRAALTLDDDSASAIYVDEPNTSSNETGPTQGYEEDAMDKEMDEILEALSNGTFTDNFQEDEEYTSTQERSLETVNGTAATNQTIQELPTPLAESANETSTSEKGAPNTSSASLTSTDSVNQTSEVTGKESVSTIAFSESTVTSSETDSGETQKSQSATTDKGTTKSEGSTKKSETSSAADGTTTETGEGGVASELEGEEEEEETYTIMPLVLGVAGVAVFAGVIFLIIATLGRARRNTYRSLD